MYHAFAADCNGFALSFQEMAPTLSKLGYDGVWFNIDRDSKISAGETKELMARYRLRAAGMDLPVNFRLDEATFREGLGRLPAYLAFARDVGITRTMTWIVPGSDELDYGENFALHRDRLGEIARLLEQYGVTLGLEFVGPPLKRKGRKYEFIHNLDGALELLDAIGEKNTGLLLDSWHWHLAGHTKADFSRITSAEQVVLAHINDAPAGIPAEEQVDSARSLPGETGVLPIGEFFDALLALDYTGPVVAEPFVADLAKLPFGEAAGIMMDAVRRVWPKQEGGA